MIAWIDEEIESAILLHRILGKKEQCLAHLNARFGNSRSCTSFKARVRKVKRPQNIKHHLHQKHKTYPDDNGAALASLAQLLGRNLVFEGQSLWYKEELIALAACSSGLTLIDAGHKIRKRLEDEYQIPRGDNEIRQQLERMQLPINAQSQSHSIWVRYHQDKPDQIGFCAYPELPRWRTIDVEAARIRRMVELSTCVKTSEGRRRFKEYSLGKQDTKANEQEAILKATVAPSDSLEAPIPLATTEQRSIPGGLQAWICTPMKLRARL
ncbi:MAG: hypothetical protein Q9184_004072 [Pyrenodesmia sp. 2 TL-2023]